jgi:hypothetical protein
VQSRDQGAESRLGGAGPSGRLREVQGGFAQLCRGLGDVSQLWQVAGSQGEASGVESKVQGESCDILQALGEPGIDREAKGDVSELGAVVGTSANGWNLKGVIVRS